MSQTKLIKQRIRSVRNIAKVTGAMQLVAVARMRKAQQGARQGKPYAGKIREILHRISAQQEAGQHPLLDLHYSDAKQVLLIVFSPQRGLCGALPGNLARHARAVMSRIEERGEHPLVVSVGRKVRDLLLRSGAELLADFSDLPDRPTGTELQPLSKLVSEQYLEKKFSSVVILFPRFVGATRQVATTQVLLPADVKALEAFGEQTAAGEHSREEAIFEPSQTDILDAIIPRYIETQLFQAKMETVASEYSARMIAMQQATDNSKEISADLTLEFNKSRQAQITAEMAEIAAVA